ncbi:unnamed protein product [Leptosia nina]|uniref:RING-type E3 ubiquitin transferase n=1 Tax=Leptosia nina TaxID=320188 RepID=A0AAV1K2Q5_9NEOP
MSVHIILKNAHPGAALDGLPQLSSVLPRVWKHCPFDQTVIQSEPEELAVNTALLQLAGYTPPLQPFHPPCIQALSESDQRAYDVIVRCLEHLAIYLKLCANNSVGNRLSRPMQRKLVTLLQCAITDEEGRGRAARAARSLGERSVTELILQHQNPQQLSANLWAAVRARGCQFLGPAMQEEVLKLVLLALEDGSALSRKVLVMFVVQRLEGDFPQASKTSIGHVVQLLYRASCFKVSKRECDSSLMQLKEEFRTYESLRREHDAQIVQIATEAGLRIAPDQWSALLYGDTAHKSHMQSIIDKLQTPQSFAQSVQELFIALQRSGDPAQLVVMSMPLDRLANIDPSPDAKSPSWQMLAEILTAVKDVVSGLVSYLQQQTTARDSNHNQKHIILDKSSETSTSQPSPQGGMSSPQQTEVAFCRESNTRAGCPRGSGCTFFHVEDDMERYRAVQNPGNNNGNVQFVGPQAMPQISIRLFPSVQDQNAQLQPSRMQRPVSLPSNEIYNDGRRIYAAGLPRRGPVNYHDAGHGTEGTSSVYGSGIVPSPQLPMPNHNNLIMPVPDRPFYGNYAGLLTVVTDDNPNIYQGQEYINHMYQAPNSSGHITNYQEAPIQQTIQSNVYIPVSDATYTFDNNMALPAGYRSPPGFPPLERRMDSAWCNTSPFNYNQMSDVLPPISSPQESNYNFSNVRDALPIIGGTAPRTENAYHMPSDRRVVGADRGFPVGDRTNAPQQYPVDPAVAADEHKLEEGLMALERRIDTEFKIT